MRQYPALMFSESLTNEQVFLLSAVWRNICNYYGSAEYYMPVQLSWFKHVTLNHGTAGSSPATGTKNPASALKMTAPLRARVLQEQFAGYYFTRLASWMRF